MGDQVGKEPNICTWFNLRILINNFKSSHFTPGVQLHQDDKQNLWATRLGKNPIFARGSFLSLISFQASSYTKTTNRTYGQPGWERTRYLHVVVSISHFIAGVQLHQDDKQNLWATRLGKNPIFARGSFLCPELVRLDGKLTQGEVIYLIIKIFSRLTCISMEINKNVSNLMVRPITWQTNANKNFQGITLIR